MGSIGSNYVRRGASAPSTIAAQLAAWSLDSMWADFASNVNSFANSDGTGSLSDGTRAHRWNQQAGNGFSAYFHNTASTGLYYRTSLHGSPALQGVSDGDSYMQLSSTTILNSISYTVLMRLVAIKETTGTMYVYAHSSGVEGVTTSSAGAIGIRAANATVTNQNVYHTHVDRINSTDGEAIVGFVASGSHNNAAPHLCCRYTGATRLDFSGSGLRRLVIVGGVMTSTQIDTLSRLM